MTNYSMEPTSTSTYAWLGIVFAFLVPAAGLGFCLLARRDIDRSLGQLGGRGLATFGLWLSSILVFVASVFVLGRVI